jgi:hypothetical protein
VTCPPPLYHGDDGEISATHRPDGAAPESVYPNGTRVHYLSTGASTGALFGLYRRECGREGSFEGLTRVAQMSHRARQHLAALTVPISVMSPRMPGGARR